MASMNLQGRYPAELAEENNYSAFAAQIVQLLGQVYLESDECASGEVENSSSGSRLSWLIRRTNGTLFARNNELKNRVVEGWKGREVVGRREDKPQEDEDEKNSEESSGPNERLIIRNGGSTSEKCSQYDDFADEEEYQFALTSLALKKYLGDTSESVSVRDSILENNHLAESKTLNEDESKLEGTLIEEKL